MRGCAGGGLFGEGEEVLLGGEEAGLGGVVACDAGGVVGEEGVQLGLFRAGALRADGGEENFHESCKA